MTDAWRINSRLGAFGHETRLRGLGRIQSAQADFVAALAAHRRGLNRQPGGVAR